MYLNSSILYSVGTLEGCQFVKVPSDNRSIIIIIIKPVRYQGIIVDGGKFDAYKAYTRHR